MVNGSTDTTRAEDERAAPYPHMNWIPAGSFLMGSEHHYPEEAPARRISVREFWMDRYPVTNAGYARFVMESGYVTVAERLADETGGGRFELLAPSSAVFRRTHYRVDLRNPFNWWQAVNGADWQHPRGPGSTILGLENHPVVHVTFEDALAYAQWAEKDLPTEPEWERAARGGLEGAEYAWGDELLPGGMHMANTWQGEFPHENLCTDGYDWTSPVGAFPPNGYGLFDMIGNVWEWTANWYIGERIPSCCTAQPKSAGDVDFEPAAKGRRSPGKVIKGGSFLCALNFCRRYRPAARMGQPINESTCHLGFRCVYRG